MAARRSYWKDRGGSSAAEFALVVLPFVTMILGVIGVSLLLYANHTLEYAAEAAARCAAIAKTPCTSASTIQTYALNHYSGPGVSPSFVYKPDGCGHTVTASAVFPLNTGLVDMDVPLSATACFP